MPLTPIRSTPSSVTQPTGVAGLAPGALRQPSASNSTGDRFVAGALAGARAGAKTGAIAAAPPTLLMVGTPLVLASAWVGPTAFLKGAPYLAAPIAAAAIGSAAAGALIGGGAAAAGASKTTGTLAGLAAGAVVGAAVGLAVRGPAGRQMMAGAALAGAMALGAATGAFAGRAGATAVQP